MRNTSLSFRFVVLFLCVFLLISGASYSVLRNVYHDQLLDQGRNIAGNVQAFVSWVSGYGRIWVKDNDKSFLGHMSVTEDKSQESVDFYSKNPALAQREYSEIVESLNISATFRMTSHNHMNPVSKPDDFETGALRAIRSRNLDEFERIIDDTYRYARTVYHTASCIKCHGDPNNAPSDVIEKYGTKAGFGFKEGDVAGIISVRIPTKSLLNSALTYFGYKEISLIALAFILVIVFVRTMVIKPIVRLTKASDLISIGKNINLGVEKINKDSRNEIDRLTLSTNRLKTSIRVAIKRIKTAPKR